MSFRTGDIVRLIKADDSGEPMRVLEVSDFPSGITLCATGKNYKGDGHDHAYSTFDTMDLELYPATRSLLASQIIKECNVIEDAITDIRRLIKESNDDG